MCSNEAALAGYLVDLVGRGIRRSVRLVNHLGERSCIKRESPLLRGVHYQLRNPSRTPPLVCRYRPASSHTRPSRVEVDGPTQRALRSRPSTSTVNLTRPQPRSDFMLVHYVCVPQSRVDLPDSAIHSPLRVLAAVGAPGTRSRSSRGDRTRARAPPPPRDRHM
jgi:hypothetical protein